MTKTDKLILLIASLLYIFIYSYGMLYEIDNLQAIRANHADDVFIAFYACAAVMLWGGSLCGIFMSAIAIIVYERTE